jgi:galactose mutarotase-like enzyme
MRGDVTGIEPVMWKQLAGYRLSRGELSLSVTDYGGKIQSILYRGREYLHQADPDAPYRRSRWGDSFEQGEFSGFDDMFPNISVSPYPGPEWPGVSLPDHGEVWSMDWRSEPLEQRLVLRADGVCLPYRLTKQITLTASALHLAYTLENTSDSPFSCLWAAHPLFILEDGMRLELPGCQRIVNVYGGQKYLGSYGEEHNWPVSNDGRDLHVLSSRNRCCSKYYVLNALTENRALLVYPHGVTVRFDAPAREVPYLGVWTDEAGAAMCCAAPEPCTGALDRLDTAVARGCAARLGAHAKTSWGLTISFYSA